MKHMQFLRKSLDALPLPPAGARVDYQDIEESALILRVSSTGHKTFAVRRKINGKAVRVTIGPYMRPGDNEPIITIAQARKRAGKAKSQAAEGKNPNELKRADRVEGMSLRHVLGEYIKDSNSIKESTARDYKTILEEVLGDWMDKPMRDITEERVLTRHRRHGDRSHARANAAMRVLRAIWNYARAFNPKGAPAIYGENPVSVLSARRSWYRIDRRRTRIKDNALPVWWAGVETLRGSRQPSSVDIADLLTLLLFTGLRPIEAYELEWEYVDLADRTIEVPDPKNREAHSLPLPGILVELFERRAKIHNGSKFVFPAPRNPNLPFKKSTMHKFVHILKDETGVEFTPYDLRRGFATVAESLDISALAVKRLLNHRTAESDVTAGYVGRDARRLSEAMEKIAKRIIEIATAKTDNVVGLKIPAKAG